MYARSEVGVFRYARKYAPRTNQTVLQPRRIKLKNIVILVGTTSTHSTLMPRQPETAAQFLVSQPTAFDFYSDKNSTFHCAKYGVEHTLS